MRKHTTLISYRAVLLSLLFTGSACAVAEAQSRIYTYTNERGMRVITNIPLARNQRKAISAAEQKSATADKISKRSDRNALKADLIAANAGGEVQSAAPRYPGPPSLHGLINHYATHYNLEPDLVRALVKAESNFDPRAVSHKGALGLMQLMPATAERYGVRNAFDAEENIAGGVHYFSDLLSQFDGDIPLALSAYNAGENLVARIRRVPNYRETKSYIARISRLFDLRRSPYLASDESSRRRLRKFRRKDGTLEITNLYQPNFRSTQ